MADTEKDLWLGDEFQPCVTASLVRQYVRHCEVEKHQLDHEIMSFEDFANQIMVAGIVSFETKLAECEKELGIIE